MQPTGGFFNILVPDIKKNVRGKTAQMQINRQHAHSQNHFCYIWACWYIHHYSLTGKSELIYQFNIPLVNIKTYILHLIPLLENKNRSGIELEIPEFYIENFRMIWSNHHNKYENDFHRYCISLSKNISNNNLTFDNAFIASVNENYHLIRC